MSREWVGYVGFIDGRPWVDEFSDDHGEARAFDVFSIREEAEARFSDVRRVRVTLADAVGDST